MNPTIYQLVDTLVSAHGARGHAVDKLEELKLTLQTSYERCQEPGERLRLRCDLEYVSGYLETPAALLADLVGKKARARQ